MTRIELAPEVLEDFDRFLEHFVSHHVEDAPARIRELLDSLQVLTHSPLIGRAVKRGRRELVIGRGSRGYIALCQFVPDIDTVFILAIRSQRESVYRRQP